MDRMAAKLKHGHWLVVAVDGEKALFLENRGAAFYPDFRGRARDLPKQNPPTREQGSNRPGRLN